MNYDLSEIILKEFKFYFCGMEIKKFDLIYGLY